MKKTLLATSMSFVVVGAVAQLAIPVSQKAVIPAQIANMTYTMRCPAYANNYAYNENMPSSQTGPVKKKSGHLIETFALNQSYIGISKYQLQTNGSVRDALVRNSSDGSVSAVWTQLTTGQNTTLRGTGYNYFDGSAWLAKPTLRIETSRTGWPSVGITSSGKEVIINHNTASGQLDIVSRAAKGTGAWTENKTALIGPSTGGNVWPRIATGGSDGKTIHIISVTAPTGLGGVKYNKQNGCLTYCRSTNDGTSWDKIHYINTLHDSAAGYTYIGGDGYAIDAKGTTVAYLVGSPTTNMILVKSTDNGNTWSKTIVRKFPIPFFVDQITDINGDMVVDTLVVTDGVFALTLDNAGNAHVCYGTYKMFNAITTDSTYSYFPYSSDVRYWNESMPTDSTKMVGFLADLNGNNTYDVPTGNPNSGTYNCGACSHPSIGLDASGKIFVAFDEVCDANDDGNGKAFRNVFATASNDGGITWSGIRRISGMNGDGFEQVYPSVSKYVDNCISFVYQEDAAAGHGVSGGGTANPDEAANLDVDAEIIYNCLDAGDLLFVSEKTSADFNISDIYPNPFNDISSLSLNVTKTSLINVDIFNVVGEKVRSVTSKQYAVGNHNISIEKGSLKTGMYLVTLRSGTSLITKRMIIE